MATSIASGSYNTLSSAYAILALDAYAQTVGEAKPENISVSETRADGSVQALVLPGGLFPRLAVSDAAKSIQMESRGDLTMYYMLTEAGFDRAAPQTEMKQGLEILHELTNALGEPLSRVDLGQDVEVHVKMRSLTTPLHDIAIVDLLPGGFEVVVEPREEEEPPDAEEMADDAGEGESGEEGEEDGAYEEDLTWVSPIGTSDSTWQPDYADIREDRVVLYGSVTPEVKEFIYKIRATNAGSFTLPPTMGESMYDRAVMARSTGGKVIVEKKSQGK